MNSGYDPDYLSSFDSEPTELSGGYPNFPNLSFSNSSGFSPTLGPAQDPQFPQNGWMQSAQQFPEDPFSENPFDAQIPAQQNGSMLSAQQASQAQMPELTVPETKTPSSTQQPEVKEINEVLLELARVLKGYDLQLAQANKGLPKRTFEVRIAPSQLDFCVYNLSGYGVYRGSIPFSEAALPSNPEAQLQLLRERYFPQMLAAAARVEGLILPGAQLRTSAEKFKSHRQLLVRLKASSVLLANFDAATQVFPLDGERLEPVLMFLANQLPRIHNFHAKINIPASEKFSGPRFSNSLERLVALNSQDLDIRALVAAFKAQCKIPKRAIPPLCRTEFLAYFVADWAANPRNLRLPTNRPRKKRTEEAPTSKPKEKPKAKEKAKRKRDKDQEDGAFNLPGAQAQPDQLPSEQIQATIIKSGGEWLRQVTIFDVYLGEGVPKDKKSVAFALTLQHPTRTLRDEEVVETMDRIIGTLQQTWGIELRG